MTILLKSLLGGICLTSALAIGSIHLNQEVKPQVLPDPAPVPQTPANERPEVLGIQAPGEVLTEVKLYFGLSKSGRRVVSETEWQNFVDHKITPRFQDGLTVLNAYGQYKDKSGRLIRENTKVVILIYQNSRQKEMDIKAIINTYKLTFRQQSVLRTTSLIKAAF